MIQWASPNPRHCNVVRQRKVVLPPLEISHPLLITFKLLGDPPRSFWCLPVNALHAFTPTTSVMIFISEI
jgi:hypothetical protein